MSKFFRNRKSIEVRKFLEANGYKLVNANGDDDIYAHPNCNYTVKIPQRNETIPTGTMDHMRKMIMKNGFSKKDILNWWKNNGYGE
jgi:predicted RNA binding protein YcfA (HicA-like mRNA interferase family)